MMFLFFSVAIIICMFALARKAVVPEQIINFSATLCPIYERNQF